MANTNNIKESISFWSWFFKKNDGGLYRIFDYRIIYDLLIGFLLTVFIETSIVNVARTILFPLFGLLIGMTFAWLANATSILQTNEIRKLSEKKEGGIKSYIYIYQTVILVVLTVMSLWSIIAMKFMYSLFINTNIIVIDIIKTMAYSSLSTVIRFCWQGSLGTQKFLIIRTKIIEEIKKPANTKR